MASENMPPGMAEGIRAHEQAKGNVGISEAQGGELPDLGNLKAQLGGIPNQAAPSADPEPIPEAILVCLAQILGQNVFRFPKGMITEVTKMLEEGAFRFGVCDVPALMSESGHTEWEISIGVNPEWRDAQAQGQGDADTLNVKGRATGVKKEFSWEDLSKMDDAKLAMLGTSREEVNENLGSIDTEPRKVVEVDPEVYSGD